jgi:mRNA degradation ribonuclease J1/J2
LKEEKSARPQDEIFEIKRRDLPKVSGKYQIQEREIIPVDFGEEFALGEFKNNTLHNVDHTTGAGAIEVGMPNGGPRLINTLDMGVGQKTERFIESVWGDGPVDMLVLDATAIGGEKRFNEPQTNFRHALEERVYSYPQSNAFVEIPQRHLQRLVNLIEVGQKTKRKVFIPIDMAYYARNLLPAEMQDSFEIYLPQRYSRQYNPVDYQKGLREIAFAQDGQRLPGVLTIEELVTETAGEKSFVVLDNNNNLMQMLNAGDISHRNKTNPVTGKVDKIQNLLISAGYNYPNQLLKNAIIDASDNAGLIYKEINITDHIPEDIMKDYLLNMTSKIILAVHTSNPASAREFVKRIQPNAIVPTISRSGLYEFVGGQKGIQKVDL